jgi:hypothetical protein
VKKESYKFAIVICGCTFSSCVNIIHFSLQAVDIKLLGSLNRDELKKICGENLPEWISFPVYEQVR